MLEFPEDAKPSLDDEREPSVQDPVKHPRPKATGPNGDPLLAGAVPPEVLAQALSVEKENRKRKPNAQAEITQASTEISDVQPVPRPQQLGETEDGQSTQQKQNLSKEFETKSQFVEVADIDSIPENAEIISVEKQQTFVGNQPVINTAIMNRDDRLIIQDVLPSEKDAGGPYAFRLRRAMTPLDVGNWDFPFTTKGDVAHSTSVLERIDAAGNVVERKSVGLYPATGKGIMKTVKGTVKNDIVSGPNRMEDIKLHEEYVFDITEQGYNDALREIQKIQALEADGKLYYNLLHNSCHEMWLNVLHAATGQPLIKMDVKAYSQNYDNERRNSEIMMQRRKKISKNATEIDIGYTNTERFCLSWLVLKALATHLCLMCIHSHA